MSGNRDLQAVRQTASAAFRAVLVFAVLAVVLLFGLALPARANVAGQSLTAEITYMRPLFCVEGDNEIVLLTPPGTNAGFYLTSMVRAWYDCIGYTGQYFIPCQPGQEPCYQDSWIGMPMPPGQLAMAQVLYIWNGSAWAVCETTMNWTYNQIKESTLASYGGPLNEIPPKPCGAGRYQLRVGAYAWDSAHQTWQGDWVQSLGVNSY
ncbi:MAG TPA: hypothetical protein VKF41_09590 [Bryobacteraceae bacterium]|nr:hypothetical protein [Bryobacteraceae bacterium]